MILTYLSLEQWYDKCGELNLKTEKHGEQYIALKDDEMQGLFLIYNNIGHIKID